jgi:hypothetical protein
MILVFKLMYHIRNNTLGIEVLKLFCSHEVTTELWNQTMLKVSINLCNLELAGNGEFAIYIKLRFEK